MRRAIGAALIWFLSAWQSASAQLPTATVEFLDVGQGDATLIRSPEGKVALVDAGPSKGIVKLLQARDVTAIDLVVVSHHHIDHYGGLDDVIREFRPTVFLASESGFTSPTYLKLLKLVEDEGISVLAPLPNHKTRKIELGSVILTLLPQPDEDADEENENSVGIRVDHGKVSILLTGDSEEHERQFWLNHGDARKLLANTKILKLAHHGSRNGTDASWLDLLKPKLAVASCAAGNSFGHPHPETLSLLTAKHVPLKRTDQDGSIKIISDGHSWQVDTTSGGLAAGRDVTPERPGRVLIDLNTAATDELKTLPGIGPALATRIIAHRPFTSVNDLIEVEGIGEKKLAELRPLVRVR